MQAAPKSPAMTPSGFTATMRGANGARISRAPCWRATCWASGRILTSCAPNTPEESCRPESGQLTPDSANQPALLASQAGALLELAQNMAPSLKGGLRPTVLRIELPLAEVIADMELAGGLTARACRLRQGLDAAAASRAEDSRAYRRADLNIASPRQLGGALKAGAAARQKTKTGYSTGADVLKHIANDHPACP